MTVGELIDYLNRLGVSRDTRIVVDVPGTVGGIGNTWARCPTIRSIAVGFDWTSGLVMFQLEKPKKPNAREGS